MIQFDSRYFNNAHRLSYALDPDFTSDFYDGQWFTFSAEGEMTRSVGTTNKKSFITLSSRYGNVSNGIGAPITNDPAGRDTVTPSGMIVVLIGPFRVTTDQYESGSYTLGCALQVSSNGKVEPWNPSTGAPVDIVGYCGKVPTVGDPTITIIHE